MRSHEVAAKQDSNLLLNDKVLGSLLALEADHQVSRGYFDTVQVEVKPWMRQTLTEWMADVCMEECSDPGVLPLSCKLVDRFLSKVAIHKTQLQALGCACLFIASKDRATRPIPSRKLVAFTANSVSLSELLSWELLVLGQLKWDVNSVTAIDLVHHVVARLPVPPVVKASMVKHATANCTLPYTDFNISLLRPSSVAAALVVDAWDCLIDRAETSCLEILELVSCMLRRDLSELHQDCVSVLKYLAEKRSHRQGPTAYPVPNPSNGSHRSKVDPTLTPTDVSEVQLS